jgi:two-component sensor histidine kinase
VAAHPSTPAQEAALSLALAVVRSSPGPLLLLDGDLSVIGASNSFCEAFDLDFAGVRGVEVLRVGEGEWASPGLGELLEASLAGVPMVRVCETLLRRPGRGDRQLVIHAERLEYFDLDHDRIMVAVFDVTQARADQRAIADAEAHNLVLLREVRHRVANSLQIVASLLLSNARKAQSEEAKSRLADAHNRVMSVAALEHQLADVGDGGVEVRTYFTSLCESIAASLVGDREQIVIKVTGPGGVVDARVSLSLGLIVTELVINALKHAFPQERHGRITVDCLFPGPNWALIVSDNGVGAPRERRDTRVGGQRDNC